MCLRVLLCNTISVHVGNMPPLFLCHISSLFVFWENTRTLWKYLVVSQQELASGNSHLGVKIKNCLQILWEGGLSSISCTWGEQPLWQVVAGMVLPGKPQKKREWPYPARLSSIRSGEWSFSSSHPGLKHGAWRGQPGSKGQSVYKRVKSKGTRNPGSAPE